VCETPTRRGGPDVGELLDQLAGGILGDFVGLARAALDDGTEESKNVAAVLAAATFEDTFRRMGESLAGVTARPELSEVLGILKEKGILTGSQVSLAQSFLQFRNRALHAEWDKIERASVHSVVAFTEQLLMKYFG
jgi:hypothetical protein